MFKEIIKTISINDKILEISTGKIASQTDSSVIVKMGESVLLCTLVYAKTMKEEVNFLPLTIYYREMAFAAGKIPGGFFKKETKSSEREVLVSRLIDRPIRPLFHPNFFNETQIMCTVLSYDPDCNTDIMAIIGASASLAISGIPCLDIIGATRVGLINDKFVLNPSIEQIKNSQLDLVVAGTKNSITMVEADANLLSEDLIIEAIEFGHKALQPIIYMIEDFVHIINNKHLDIPKELYSNDLKKQINFFIEKDIKNILSNKSKKERNINLNNLEKNIIQHFTNKADNSQFSKTQIIFAFKSIKSEIYRDILFSNEKRIDNRNYQEIRPINCEISILPRTHGSSLFTRGETQAIVTTTLGTSYDEQIIDALDGEYKESFMLNYIFPSYSVGELNVMKAPGRREIGHSKLAWKAFKYVLPNKEQFPYSIRVVSEITSCNGSSSMATICGTSMALMNAGVPIKEPIAGISIGLFEHNNTFKILSDITSDEDELGDMDFKIAGSTKGISALQMDIKISGIKFDIMKLALTQARAGLTHILNIMNNVIDKTNNISNYAPRIYKFKINKDKIRDVIGSGGKVIREISQTTDTKIDINQDGIISIVSMSQNKLELAIDKIKCIISEPEIGNIFNGTVVKVLNSGAFINYSGNRDGFVHISEISQHRIDNIANILKHGDIVKVKLIGFDYKGKAKLTIKNIDTEISAVINIKSNKSLDNNSKDRESNNANIHKITKERKYFS